MTFKANSQKGAAMIEAAVSLGVFLMVVFMIFDLFWLSYNAVALQHIATEAVRTVNTTTLDGSSKAPAGRYCDKANVFQTAQQISSCRGSYIATLVKDHLASGFGLSLKGANDRVLVQRMVTVYKPSSTNLWFRSALMPSDKCPDGAPDISNCPDAGKGGDLVMVQVTRRVPVLFGILGDIPISGASVGRNELFG